MERTVLGWVDRDDTPHLTGRLWARVRGGKESAWFECDKSWLENPLRFSLEPALLLGPGPYHTACSLMTRRARTSAIASCYAPFCGGHLELEECARLFLSLE